MQYTSNYNIPKYDGTDLLNPTSREGLNSGNDIIDTQLKSNADAILTKANSSDVYSKSQTYTKTEVDTALENKVNKENGKGLSTNDYDNTEKGNVASNTSARHTHSNMSVLNDIEVAFTQDDKNKLDGLSYGKYGARRLLTSSNPTLTRIWDAEGKVANVTVGSATVQNDFDSIYPWSDMRVCNISIVDGEIVVNAYKGETNFKRDGSNGQVVVEIPPFYYCPHTLYEGYETYGVSATYQNGWVYSQRKYLSCYNAVQDGASALKSISGAMPLVSTSLTSFRTKARATDSVCQVWDMDDWNTLTTLFCCEFATINTQAMMQGASGMRYNAEDTIASVVSDTEFTCANASYYVEGQAISIGTSKNGSDKSAWVQIDTINGTTVKLKSSVAGLSVGNYISTRTWVTGSCDNIGSPSGHISNDTKHPCCYRGIENFWGNIWQWVDGILINDNQGYICTDKTKFSSSLTSDYDALSYTNLNSNGYVKRLGVDTRYPQARFCVEDAGSSSTYFSDYYYQNAGLRACFVGAFWDDGALAGPFCFFLNYAPSDAYVAVGSRLSWKTI